MGTRWRSLPYLTCVGLLFGGGFASLAVPASAQVRRVVLLYDERTDLPGLARLDSGLVRTLTAGLPGAVELYREPMDLSRFQSDRYPVLLADYLHDKYAGKKIDVVVAAMGPALDFMLEHGTRVFPGASIVFCGIDRRELGDRRLPSNVTGVLVKREFAPTLGLALRLHPATRRVLFVAGNSEFDRRLANDARVEFGATPYSDLVEYLIGLPMADLLDTLAHLPPRTVVLYSTMFTDVTGRPFVPHDVVEQLARTTNAPLYAFVDQYLGRGIIGGHLYSIDANGEEAARLALRLLAGTPAASIPPVEPRATISMFDWRQLRRWGIDERQLPAGAIVQHRDMSPWTRYRVTILATAVVLLLQAVLIATLLVERRLRRRAQMALRESEARAQEQRRELAHLGRVALVGELSAALAHEIHQPLTAILTNARVAKRLLEADDHERTELRAILEDIAADDQRAAAVVDHVRSLIKKEAAQLQLLSMNDVVGEVLGLLHNEIQHRGVVITTSLCAPAPTVFADRVQLQQVLLNLIVNACDAMSDTPADERLLVVSTSSNGDARIEVRDRGSGFAPKALASVFEPFVTTKRDGLGLGLAICRSIITAHRGRMWAVNNQDRGATLVVALPLATEER